MDIIILCGGQGARMREETEYRPKPMVEVGGRPLLWHIMRLFGHHGLNRFVLCLGYKGSMIKHSRVDKLSALELVHEFVNQGRLQAARRVSLTALLQGLCSTTGFRPGPRTDLIGTWK